MSSIYSYSFLSPSKIKINRFFQKLVLRKHSHFLVTFWGVFPTLLKTIAIFIILTPKSTS